MLLENVWVENYHDFGEFSRQRQLLDHTAFNVPLTRDLFGHVNGDLSNFPHLLGGALALKLESPSRSLPRYIAVPDDLPPPALPPKKNRSGLLRRQQETSNPSSQPSTPGRISPSSSVAGHRTVTGPASTSPRERFIPIVREGDGSLVVPCFDTATGGAANGTNNNGSKRLSSDSANSSSASLETRANQSENTEATRDRESRRHHHHHHHHHHSHKKKKKKRRGSNDDASYNKYAQ